MLRTLKRIVLRKTSQQSALATEVRELTRQIACVRDCWNFAADDDLIESYTYLLLSLEARYRYLLNAAKAQERAASASPRAVPLVQELPEEVFA